MGERRAWACRWPPWLMRENGDTLVRIQLGKLPVHRIDSVFPILQMNLCQPRQGYRLGESVKGYPPRVPPRVRDAGCGMRCKPTVLSPDHFRQRTSGFVTRPTRAVNSRAPKLQPGCRGGRKVCFLHPSSSPFCRHLLGLLK